MTKLEKWFSAPLAKDIVPDEVVCSCCNSKKNTHLMRFVVDGPGMICKSCYFSGPECACTTCDQPTVYKSSYCRDHFMGEVLDPHTLMMHTVMGSTAVSASYPQHEDAEGARGYTQFKKDLEAAMEREGINWRQIEWIR